MSRTTRVAEDLNYALHELFARRDDLYLLGEDIADPYGGAFKITRGLSDVYPDQVLPTPISESGFVGVASGLALAGDAAVVEIMFGDFATLCFDQLVNFASKSVSMYGRTIPMRLVVRCLVGGHRGYGPTHSQSLQKHFIGIPHLWLHEMSPFHGNLDVLTRILERGEPCVFFEDKSLYPAAMCTSGAIDELFAVEPLDGAGDWARVALADGAPEDSYDCLLIAPGGAALRAVRAMRELVLEDEIDCRLLVPSQLYPVEAAVVEREHIDGVPVVVVEEGTAGGSWGTEVASHLHDRLWGCLPGPVWSVCSRPSTIPADTGLEREVLLGEDNIRDAVRKALR
ncbi:transketolase C-terminal domain-containing protein [Pseudonocardia sp. HH130629-09]|uniref:transketolase C-terminal domain-containing protein n=1 Tax=Pseudonocardia sp. HH130629-09 TaxID=1641402 RepID=UPI0006CB5DE2|nr:transketolase C-terminal domain-containing protein [Pseudonocardia sp. HH130629-09]ALE82793.1 pyruvate dehydrogenase [Pseudonocardia sp. HH130629-09]